MERQSQHITGGNKESHTPTNNTTEVVCDLCGNLLCFNALDAVCMVCLNGRKCLHWKIVDAADVGIESLDLSVDVDPEAYLCLSVDVFLG